MAWARHTETATGSFGTSATSARSTKAGRRRACACVRQKRFVLQARRQPASTQTDCAHVSFAAKASSPSGIQAVGMGPPRRDMPHDTRHQAVQRASMSSQGLLSLLTLACLSTVSATNHTDDGLSGGAIAGIIIGVLACLIIIGLVVYYFFFRDMGASAKDSGGSGTIGYAASAGDSDERHLPMVALRVSGNDDL